MDQSQIPHVHPIPKTGPVRAWVTLARAALAVPKAAHKELMSSCATVRLAQELTVGHQVGP